MDTRRDILSLWRALLLEPIICNPRSCGEQFAAMWSGVSNLVAFCGEGGVREHTKPYDFGCMGPWFAAGLRTILIGGVRPTTYFY